MRYLIDANSVIYLTENLYPKLTTRVSQMEVGSIGLSAIVFAELIVGAKRGKPPRLDRLASIAGEMPLLPFDEAAARAYGEIPFRRGSFDRLLAAHALSLGMEIITTNVRDFADSPGLQVEDWTL